MFNGYRSHALFENLSPSGYREIIIINIIIIMGGIRSAFKILTYKPTRKIAIIREA